MSRRTRELEAERDAARKDAEAADKRARSAEEQELAIRGRYAELAESVAEKQGDNAKKIADAAAALDEMADAMSELADSLAAATSDSEALRAQLALVAEERDAQRTSLELSLMREQVLADDLATWRSWHESLPLAHQPDGPTLAPRPRDWKTKIGEPIDTEAWRPTNAEDPD